MPSGKFPMLFHWNTMIYLSGMVVIHHTKVLPTRPSLVLLVEANCNLRKAVLVVLYMAKSCGTGFEMN